MQASLTLRPVGTPAGEPHPALGTDFEAAPYAAFQQGRTGTGAGDEQSAKARANAQHHRQALTLRLTDAVKLVAAHYLRDEARAAAYFRFELLLAPEAAAPPTASPPGPAPKAPATWPGCGGFFSQLRRANNNGH